jgi:ABC-type phosphate transport system auxiliary subunit
LTFQNEPLQLLLDNTIDLINRLQAENSNLSSDLTSLQADLTSLKAENARLRAKKWQITDMQGLHAQIKVEAYKEFVEELCENRVSNDPVVIAAKCLLEEKVGESNAET